MPVALDHPGRLPGHPYWAAPALAFACETEITMAFPVPCPGGPIAAGRGKDAARQTADGLLFYRPDCLGRLVIHRIGEITMPGTVRAGPLSYPDHLSGPDDIAGPHPRTVTFPQVKPPDGRWEDAMARLTARFSPGKLAET